MSITPYQQPIQHTSPMFGRDVNPQEEKELKQITAKLYEKD